MNSVWVIVFSAVIFILAYHLYGRFVAKLFGVDPQRKTPAHSRGDNVDFIPAKNWFVLFGHHFSSIAGAGPIVGPVIAVCIWGWVPAFLWVVLGSIFLGGIHDFGSLFISLREDGTSIGDIASRTISRKAKLVLSIFTLLALILVIAVFAYLGADTLVSQPEIVLPSLGILPIAVVVGLALYRFRLNSVAVTICALLLLAVLIVSGKAMPLSIGENGLNLWIILLLIYCFVASITPVNYLLQPRDYLSSFLLIAGIILAFAGILISHPSMNTPAFIAFDGELGYLWPMMFITIACGANSGFHSLIASGTTSKQLDTEAHAKRIGFGAMILEGFLATVVIVLVVGGLSLTEFRQHLADQTSPVNLYGVAFGAMTHPILKGWGTFIALTILNAFILTTLDSATRISRYIAEELFQIKNRYICTLGIVFLAGLLALGKDSAQTPLWKVIWPAFGASNQLVAALALLVISCWLLAKNKPDRYALIPALFMLLTSLAALGFQMIQYFQKQQYLLIGISAVLISSAFYLCREVICVFLKREKNISC